MIKTQYSDLVPEQWFAEYKKTETSGERKEKIAEDIFKILRSVNTFPEFILSDDEKNKALKSLIVLEPHSLYKEDGAIEMNSVGVSLCSTFYPNIYDVKKAGIDFSMRDYFHDDNQLRRSIRKILEYGTSIKDLMGWIRISGCGYCNNFRPTAARVIYDVNLKRGSRVYDYAAGYGGRLLGAWAAENVIEYAAVDPNTETYNNAHRFGKFLETALVDEYNYENYKPELEKWNIYKMGSEDFSIKNMPQYEKYFDMAFSSPQYFNTEIYSSEETQSCFKFTGYKGWVHGFLRPTIHNCIDVLKDDGLFGINIFVNLPKVKQVINYICNEKGFKLYKVDKLTLQVMPGLAEGGEKRSKLDKKYEPIFWFKKV